MSAIGATKAMRWSLAITLALVGCFAVLSFASPALAQVPGPVEEYAPGDPGDNPDDGVAGVDGSGGPSSDGSGGGIFDPGGSGGELPFTGYPLSWLALLCIALLAAGGVIRGAVAYRERSRRQSAPGAA